MPAAAARTTRFDTSKVAKATLVFWIMKICATTVGETGGDLISMTLNVGFAMSSVVLLGVFLVCAGAQLGARAFHPALYWTVILAASTVGTTLSDYLDHTLGLTYGTTAAALVVALAAIFAAWRLTTGAIAIDDIRDRPNELFYWAAILASNTLGTATGDYLASASGFGYALSNLLITGALALTAVAYAFTRIPLTLLFWTAFVLTRPFGATMGDLLTKGPAEGGLGFGTVGSSLVLLAVLAVLVVVTARASSKGEP